MTRLHDLYEHYGQSPWLDNLQRGWLTSGELARRIESGVRGITSNPTIFQKAISGSDAYDEEFRRSIQAGDSVTDAYWDLVTTDIADALDLLRPTYDASGGTDGFVSIELAPEIARDPDRTVEAARRFHDRLDAPNLLVKVPGTIEGVGAVRTLIGEGRNINITLLFGLDRYEEIIEAYLSGLESHDGDLSHISSVASFFVSRVDTEINRRLDEIATPEATALKGKAAIANAQLAYDLFKRRFAGPRWDALAARGAQLQKPLWASTSVKDDAYPDTLYVDNLIAPDTVNTMPEDLLDTAENHATLERTADADLDAAGDVLASVETVGVDLDDVARTLTDEGVASFAKSFDELISALRTKAEELS